MTRIMLAIVASVIILQSPVWAGTYFSKGKSNKVIGKFSFDAIADKSPRKNDDSAKAQEFFFINSDSTNSVRVYLQPLDPDLKRDLSEKLHYSVCLKFEKDCDNRCEARLVKVLEILPPDNPGITKYDTPPPCP